MNSLLTIGLLILSNVFMTFAWYGHLKLAEYPWFNKLSLFGIIIFSWLIAFFEYCFQVPANRIGFEGNGGNFSLVQLKVIQEVITLVVFVVFLPCVSNCVEMEPSCWLHFFGVSRVLYFQRLILLPVTSPVLQTTDQRFRPSPSSSPCVPARFV